MRILTVGNMYPPHHLGGYEIAWESAVRHLRSMDHDVRVLTTSFRLPDRRDDPADSQVFRGLQWYWRDGDWPRLSMPQRLRLERHNANVLAEQLRRWRPEAVCWWAMGGMSLSLIERLRRSGFPAGFVVCDDWLLYGLSVDAWMRAMNRIGFGARAIERILGIPARLHLESAGPWLFLSETLRSRALDAGWRLEETTVCGRGVERPLFRPAPAHEWRWRLLYAGRIDRRKGIGLAIRALAHLPANAELVVDGRGDDEYLNELRSLVRERGLADRVTFATSPRPRLRDVYAAADAVLFPVEWHEPWGLVPLEAMSVGIPVIATGRGGSGEYLRDGENCVLFDPEGGPEALANAIRRLASDEPLRSRLRERGFETTSRFGEHDFDRAVEALIQRAVAHKAVSGPPRS